ncbi:hypothetical protein [Halomonas halocynthiae]|uniref:hypothetical protein n=1 Tax=Halomonas halocynthiae TaxID=176290 RepID=UPI00040854F1|nr:hypothetical protein [Halomonas halocynthiae]
MTLKTIRQCFAPALLAAAMAPLSLSAIAAPNDATQNDWREGHQQRYSEHRQALFERAGIDAATRQALEDAQTAHRDTINALRKEHRELMDELISDEQRQALKNARQEIRQEMRDEHRQAVQLRIEEQLDEWELSTEEKQALSDIRESFQADMQDLKDRRFDSRDERRKAWQNLRQDHHDAIAEILSEEQIQELRSHMRGAIGSQRSRHGSYHQKHHHGQEQHRGF